MEEDKGESRQEGGLKDMKRKPLPTANTTQPAVDPGHDQSVVPTLTSDLVRMIESSPDGRLDLKQFSQELQVPRSKIDYVSSILEGIKFVERTSADIVQMTNRSEHHKLAKRLEESWKEEDTLDGWISQLQKLRFNSPERQRQERKDDDEDKDEDTKKANHARNDSTSTSHESHMDGKRILLSPHPSSSSTPSTTTSSTPSYPRPATRRRTTPVYIFGQSTPFKRQFTPSDRLVQVSSEDTEESMPSSRSDASNFSSPESLPHPLSPAATVRNARSRVLLLANSPDHDYLASSSTTSATTKTSAASADTKQTPAGAASNLKDYDFSKKRVPSFVSKEASPDEMSKRPKSG